MIEETKSPEDKHPLLLGRDTKGRLVIQKGDQQIIVLPWEIKVLKKIVYSITEE